MIRESIRKAIAESGRTRYAVAKQARVPASRLYAYLAGSRSLNLESLERLCLALGLTLGSPAKKRY